MADPHQASSGGASVRAVVFDLFNTLTVPLDDLEYRSSLKEMALAVGTDSKAFTHGWFDLWRELFDGTFSTVQACVRGLCESLGVRADASAVDKASQIRIECTRRSLIPRPDAMATLAQLRALGLQTALISNCMPDIPLIWSTTPYAEAFDEPLFSCAERLTKPDPAIYLRACERLRVDPRDCLYVGDGAHGELSGAASAGMRAVLIKTPEESTAAYDSERASWRGESIEALSELPSLITGSGAAPAD